MRCRVLLFAQLREVVGVDQFVIELPANARVSDALERISIEHTAITQFRSRMAVAVNQHYATATDLLRDGDVIALIPPVSGG